MWVLHVYDLVHTGTLNKYNQKNKILFQRCHLKIIQKIKIITLLFAFNKQMLHSAVKMEAQQTWDIDPLLF